MTGTTYYNLNLPAHGDQNWDTPVNANFTSIDSILHEKQDGLTPGGDIDITSNTISLKKDGTSITDNTSGQIQATGVISTADGSTVLKARPITKADYDTLVANGTVDANTFYGVTDDMNVTLTVLEALFPVGALYLTTANSCPLQALGVGTWELVSSGRVLQGADSNHAAGTTIEAGLPNITGRTNDVYPGTGATTTGAFYSSGSNYLGLSTNTDSNNAALFFDASRSSSIYGNSSTVQPPAYVANIFRRVS